MCTGEAETLESTLPPNTLETADPHHNLTEVVASEASPPLSKREDNPEVSLNLDKVGEEVKVSE